MLKPKLIGRICVSSLLIGVFVMAAFGTTAFAAAASSTTEGVPSLGHVFLIIGENTGYSQVNMNNAPFLIGIVQPESAWLTNYYAVTHYSESNYIAITSGQFTACQQLDGPPSSCHQNVPNLFGQLDAAGVTWANWLESMPSSCYLSSSGSNNALNNYAPKHNPAIFYDNIEGQNGVWSSTSKSAECLANDLPAGTTGPDDMSIFNSALKTGNVPQFNLVIPNECEDAHNNCKPAGNAITQFDDFLAREVPAIQSSPAFGTNGVIIITFDEGLINGPHHADKFGNGGNVVFAVISPLAHPATYTTGPYDHYSLLRTLEDGYGITTYLGNATSAAPITGIWG